ncbi:MAG: hypothetical protein QMC80_01195, partial [Thermoplasmatales archaeon]|nr:hypothetical protein [Thermoplasmatales archaeon]
MKKLVALILILAVLLIVLSYIFSPSLKPSQHVKEGKGGDIPMVDSDDDGLPDIKENYDYGTDYNNPDTDGDGVPDNWEAEHMRRWSNVSQKYEPADPNVDDATDDCDSDGLGNFDEWRHGTDPGNNDTDFDGMPDGWEVKYSLNPLNPDDAYDDYDNDNLTNIQEYQHDTNPNKNDSDNDGLNDYDEIFIHRTEPNNPDSDFDGMPDGWEVKNGLNPLIDDACNDDDDDSLTNLEEYMHDTDPGNPDTDFDGMPDGWEVKYDLNPLKDDAFNDDDNDNLTNIEEYMNSTFPDNPDSDNDGLSDGDEVLVYHTIPLNPDSDNDGLWDGYNITVEAVFHIGERSIGTDANSPDTDEDGLNDYDEFVLYKTNPNKPDSDDDGLEDGEEIFLTQFFPELMDMYPNIKSTDHTDPLNPDTDDDALLDGEEVKKFINRYDGTIIVWFTNPLNPDSDGDKIPDGWEAKYAKYRIDGFYNIDPRNFDANNDSDNDELTNIQEYNIGTDPNNPDSDFDGMPDGWEVFHQIFNTTTGKWTMNPIEYDADNDIDSDNLTNLQEYLYSIPESWNVSLNGVWWNGTNPNNCDTDFDGMPDGWELKYDLSPLNPDDATEDPDSDTYVFPNGAFIRWANLDEYRYSITEEWGNETIWVGGKTINRLKNGVWWNGTNPLKNDTDNGSCPDGWEVYYNFDPTNSGDDVFDSDFDELNNYDEFVSGTSPRNPDTDNDRLLDGFNVTVFYDDENWSVYQDWIENRGIVHVINGSIYTFIGEQSVGTKPLNNDTDGDGMNDGDEVENGLDPNNPDVNDDNDNDGLTNQEEIQNGTNPNNPDSDFDGLLDGWNVTLNPANPRDFEIYNLWLSAGYYHDGYTFLGELSYKTNATNHDTDNGGCWDGWEVHYGFNPTDSNDDSFDPDFDELSNSAEFVLGTNPLNPDTDNDRLLDGFNVTVFYDNENWSVYQNWIANRSIIHVIDDNIYTFIGELNLGTDPTDPDTDGDSVNDGEEIENGFDPNNNESHPENRTCTQTIIFSISPDPNNHTFYKGEHFNVTGMVINLTSSLGAANITVYVYLNQSGESYLVGVGKTNETGWFRIECIIPDEINAGTATLAVNALGNAEYVGSWGTEEGEKNVQGYDDNAGSCGMMIERRKKCAGNGDDNVGS